MTQLKDSALFQIMEAAPEKYIRKPSSAFVVVIRAIEAVAAFIMSFKVIDILRMIVSWTPGSIPGLLYLMPGLPGMNNAQTETVGSLGVGSAVSSLLDLTLGLARDFFPQELIQTMDPEGSLDLAETVESTLAGENNEMIMDFLRQTMPELFQGGAEPNIMIGGSMQTFLCAAAAIGLLVILICTIIEAASLIALRFALKGSGVVKVVHRVIFYSAIAVMAASIGLCVLFVIQCKQIGVAGVLSSGMLKSSVITIVLCLLFLMLRVSYHRDIVKVMTAVDFEIRLGFKETAAEIKHLSRDTLIHIVIFLVLAVLLAIDSGFRTAAFIAAVILFVKYIMVYSCWTNFHHAHM